ncbi:MAG: rod shape-determining protein RodA, partial [Deltaproteobacteria bacterium]
ARSLHRKLGPIDPPLEDLLWFRALLLGLVVCGCVAALVWIVRSERAASLLHPWPRARRRQWTTTVVLGCCALLALVASAWHTPVLADPFGLAIRTLNRGAQLGGAFANLNPGPGLRLFLGLGLGLYLLASLLYMRHGVDNLIDVLVAPLDILALPALMTLVQPDLGTAGIIILIGMTIILVVGVRLRSLLIMGVGAALTSGVAWFGILKDYQKRRILTFIDPEQDVQGAGWNAVQSLIAVGSGRFFGKGHMGGTQTQLSFLPEQHTDFAFSVWAEEQGFLGCSLLLLLYLALLTVAFAVAAEARDAYGTLLATGIAALILWQAIINIGMVIGVLPVVGLTLPLFSYGGSSVLTVMLSIGLLLNIHWRRRAH